MAKQLLTAEILPVLVGKTISWSAPAYNANHPYRGIATITAVDMNKRNPISAETIEGDEIHYGFVDPKDPFTEGCVAYSDSDRHIMFELV
jgi:hypothetical protein